LISWVASEGLWRFSLTYLSLTFHGRGKATCGDIDILVTRPTSDGITHAGERFCLLITWCRFTRNIFLGLLPELLARLHAGKILTEDLALPDDFSALELCYRGLCKRPEPEAKRRRIDILCVPWENRGAALLYYTVSDSSIWLNVVTCSFKYRVTTS
jgi:DNA polymerase lambda